MSQNFLKLKLLIPFILLLGSSSSIAEIKVSNKNNSTQKITTQQSINLENIKNILVKRNLELNSLEELIKASSYNLSSKLSKRYPSLNLNINGLPQYLYSKNYSNKANNTKTSQYKINPSLDLKWDLIDPQRGLEIKAARNNFEISKNNFEIKKQDLIQEAKSRYHKYQKSVQDEKNAQISINLSETSIKDAKSKLEVGVGTKFEVLEANSQLARDKQLLKEKTIEKEINLFKLKEILNIKSDEKIVLVKKQSLTGFWVHPLERNINNGVKNSLSLRNIQLQNSIKDIQAKTFQYANKPTIFISNSLSSSFAKGSSLTTEIDPGLSSSSYSNNISLNFTWRIFNGGQNKNGYKSKVAEGKSEQFKYLNLRNIIQTNINEAFLNLLKSKEKVISTRQEIISSKEALKLTRLRYEIGISTLKDVLVRQEELTLANSKNINAIFNYNINLDKLERLTFLERSKTCNENNSANDDLIYSICDD
tara:strand:- start:210 stop:1646 length:1437 start_codon:yes stop_codon:yes gene_type:complete